MKPFIDLQKKLVPEILETMKQRYTILQSVHNLEPIGRRALAEDLHLTERAVRSEIDFLQHQGLINVTSKGMYISSEGKMIIEQLADFIRELSGLTELEQQIREKLNVADVIIVPGNSDQYEWVKQEMGKVCVAYLKKIIQTNSIVAVTGGTTMAAVANAMTPLSNHVSNLLFLPARGGIGQKVENQASEIVAEMAKKTNGDYRLLYVPDPLSESAYQTLVNEPFIKEILEQIQSANVVIHGIGEAQMMAKRRKTSDAVMKELLENRAVSEAFGYYFDHQGKIVHKVRTVGIQLEDLENIEHVIAVAGGASKAEAIYSYCKQGKSDLLITDEAAAEAILRG